MALWVEGATHKEMKALATDEYYRSLRSFARVLHRRRLLHRAS
jgi:hypothetical protein